jgi:hypothetical protein
LLLRDFVNPRSFYKDRINDIKSLKVFLRDIYIYQTVPVIKFNCNNYEINIQLIGEEVNERNDIRVSCTCPSFNFEFAHILHDDNSLFMSENFRKAISAAPKKKNKYNIVTGCKHTIACAMDVYKNLDKIQLIVNKKRS